jgi:hypothetical protein
MDQRHEQTEDQAEWQRNHCHQDSDGCTLNNIGKEAGHHDLSRRDGRLPIST